MFVLVQVDATTSQGNKEELFKYFHVSPAPETFTEQPDENQIQILEDSNEKVDESDEQTTDEPLAVVEVVEVVDYKDLDTSILDLSVTRVTADGTFTIKSRVPFLDHPALKKQLQEERRLKSESIISMKVIQQNDKEVDLTWNVTEVTSNNVTFQLEFENPEEVSMDSLTQHKLDLRIHDARAFASEEN